jgi:hypothetical protein
VNAPDHGLKGHSSLGMGLRIEHDLRMPNVLFCTLLEIGKGQVVKIGFVQEHRSPLVIDVQEILQAIELVGLSELFHAGIRDFNSIPFGDLEHELGLESSFYVQVKLCLRKIVDEFFHSAKLGILRKSGINFRGLFLPDLFHGCNG